MWFGFPSKITEHGHLKVQIKQALAARISSPYPTPVPACEAALHNGNSPGNSNPHLTTKVCQ